MEKEKTNDIIMDLEIPLEVYIMLLLIMIFVIIFKYFFSKEDIFEFIEKSKKSFKNVSDEEDKLNLLTQLNTKINRDYLDNSKYYYETGYFKIYGNKKEKLPLHSIEVYRNDISHTTEIEKKNKILIKKSKKVLFSDNIFYENQKTCL